MPAAPGCSIRLLLPRMQFPLPAVGHRIQQNRCVALPYPGIPDNFSVLLSGNDKPVGRLHHIFCICGQLPRKSRPAIQPNGILLIFHQKIKQFHPGSSSQFALLCSKFIIILYICGVKILISLLIYGYVVSINPNFNKNIYFLNIQFKHCLL